MYATPAYLYQQIQTVLITDTSGLGPVFDRRWNTVYAKNLTLNLGVDNVFLFQFLNQDQKPVNITGSTFTLRIISQNGENLLLSQDLVTLAAAQGRARVVIPAADTLALAPQPANWSLSYRSGVLDQAVYVDSNSSARGSIDIVDSVLPAFQASRPLTIPDQAPVANVSYSSVLETSGTNLTTFQIDTGTFVGNVSVEGAVDLADTDAEWYQVSFIDHQTGDVVSVLPLTPDQRRGISVLGYHPQLRLELDSSQGRVGTVLYR